MSATRTWYPHYIDDFNRKTGHLSLAERGAYRALIDAYWSRQGPLPADDKALCRLICAFPDEWAEVRENVLAFFIQKDGKLFHKRIDEEIRRAKAMHAKKARNLANARAAKAESKQQDALYTEQSSEQCSTTQSQSQSQSPDKNINIISLDTARAKDFDILNLLDDGGLAKAKSAAPGWDIYSLAASFNEGVRSKKLDPPKFPNKAFPGWCASITKGKPPPGSAHYEPRSLTP